MRKLGVVVVLMSLCSLVIGQPSGGRPPSGAKGGVVLGVVKDSVSKEILEFATVAVYSEKNDSLITGVATNIDGEFRIDRLRPGSYKLKIEFIAFTPKWIRNVVINRENRELNLGDVFVSPNDMQLDEIEVVGEASRMQLSLDKKVFNVGKDLASTGGNATEVLENIPGLELDVDGNVSMRGSNNVRILIDGKPSGLTGISGDEALKQIPANMIDRVEIITNPSARYDAEGMSGIINIILKKEKEKGVNGSVNVGLSYPFGYNAGVNLNVRRKKVNFFGGVNLYNYYGPGGSNATRLVAGDSPVNLTESQDMFHSGNRLNYRLGTDFELGKSSITISGSTRNGTGEDGSDYTYRFFNSPDLNVLSSETIRENENFDASKSYELSTRYFYEFEQKGRTIEFNYQYSENEKSEDQVSTEDFYDEKQNLITSDGLEQTTIAERGYRTNVASLDYIHPVKDGKVELGGKSTYTYRSNNFEIREKNQTTEEWEILQNLSNNFMYHEQVYAGYALFGKKKGKFDYQLGLRLEHTEVTTFLEHNALNPFPSQENESPNKKYTNLFPTGHFNYKLSETNSVQLSYSRRINRPGFFSLNPFLGYNNPYSLFRGNPYLNPELSHSLELALLSFKEKISVTSSVYYRRTDDVIQRITTFDEEGRSIVQPENLSVRNSMGVEVVLNQSLGKIFKINYNLNTYYRSDDGGNLGATYENSYFGWSGSANVRAKLSKTFGLQFQARYRSPRATIQGKRKYMLYTDFGFSKDLMKGKATLSGKVRDIFNTRKYRFELDQEPIYYDSEFQWRKRGYNLSFSYRLNQKKKRGGRSQGGGGNDMGM